MGDAHCCQVMQKHCPLKKKGFARAGRPQRSRAVGDKHIRQGTILIANRRREAEGPALAIICSNQVG